MNALHPLGQLIQSVEDSKGWTLREIARRIDRGGYSMTHSHVGNLKRKPIRSITYDMVQALAAGLDVPERLVALVAVESMGVHDVNPFEAGAAVAIARDPSLSERDRRVLLAAVREMQREDDQESPQETEQPANDSVPLARDAQPDGLTPTDSPGTSDTAQGLSGTGEIAQGRQRSYANDRPWEQDEYGLAAKRGRNRGREARAQQDRAAEDGGA